MTSDLVWDLVFVFKKGAVLKTSSSGASASLKLWKLAWFSQGVRGAWERACFSRAYEAEFKLTQSVPIY